MLLGLVAGAWAFCLGVMRLEPWFDATTSTLARLLIGLHVIDP